MEKDLILLSHESTEIFLASLGLPVSAYKIEPIMFNFQGWSSYDHDHRCYYPVLRAYESNSGLQFDININKGTSRGPSICEIFWKGKKIAELIDAPEFTLSNWKTRSLFLGRHVLLYVAQMLSFDIISSIKYLGIEGLQTSPAFTIVASGLKKREI